MATVETTPASGAKTRRDTTPKAAPKSTTRAKATKRATTPRASNSSASAKRSAPAVKTGTVGSYAERAVLIPVGAALIAREQVLARVNDTIGAYSTPSKAGAQLRKFERRGSTARNRLEREVRKTRVRVEREVRQTRGRVEREVRQTRGVVEREVRRRQRHSEELANRVQERIQSLV
jgi:hypothetical protein